MRYCWFALVMVASSALGSGAARAGERPNVVLIIADDQAWTDYGFMGHAHLQTPHLDRMAAESLVFTRGYVPSSLCRPSLASMITGVSPHRHRIVGNDPAPNTPERREAMIRNLDRYDTLPRLLGEAGYRSLQTGKWWEGAAARGGFTHGMTRGFPEPGGRHGDDGLKIGREGLEPILEFLDDAEARERPFFLWYAPFLPHTPHTPPQRLFDQYADQAPTPAIARYWAMCQWFDETCGQLLQILDDRGLAETTIVLYVADNGWINDPAGARYAPRSKRSQYDGGLRTPLMVRWPGTVTPRMDRVTPVSSLDLAPTILTAAGLGVPAAMEGVDLLDEAARSAREGIFGAVFAHDVQDLERPAETLHWRWVVADRYKLIVHNPSTQPDGQVELFDVIADPFETRNLAGVEPDRVDVLSAMIDAWWQAR